MALDVNDIQPMAPMAPMESPASDMMKSEPTADIPDEVLAIPALGAVLQGKPPAVSALSNDQSPEVQILSRNIEPLSKVFGFYTSQDGSKVVMFNSQFISPEEIQLADQKGQLELVAPPLSELSAAFPAAPGAAPALPAVPGASAPPMPASAQRRITTARAKNLQSGSPTSGPAPGAGRLMNDILKTSV